MDTKFLTKNLPAALAALCCFAHASGAVANEDPLAALYYPGEYIIERAPSQSAQELESYLSSNIKGLSMQHTLNSNRSLAKVPLSKRGWINFNEYLEILENAPGVKQTSPNFRYEIQSVGATLNDPMVPNQWYLEAINAPQAWEVSREQQEIIVAVIDSPIMVGHEDLKDNIWINPKEIPNNGRDDDGNGYIDDVYGWNFTYNQADPSPSGLCATAAHGTHVAGTIGAVISNSKGVAGVARKVKIMALSVARGEKGCRGIDGNSTLAAIDYAVANGAKIINLSLGGPFTNDLKKAVYQKASDNGVLLITAAGNDGLDNDVDNFPADTDLIAARIKTREGKVLITGYSPHFPSNFAREIPGVMAIANLEQRPRELALFVQRFKDDTPIYYNERLYGVKLHPNGDATHKNQWVDARKEKWSIGSSFGLKSVDLGVPGTDIYNALPGVPDERGVKQFYGNMTGTSMASPIAAGAAAVVWANFPELTNVQVKERLMLSAKKTSSLNGKVKASGQLDLYAALCGKQFTSVAAGCSGAQPGSPAPAPAPAPAPEKPVQKQPPVAQKPTPARPAPTPPSPPRAPTNQEKAAEIKSWLTE